MGSNLPEVSSFPANVLGPDAGNTVTAASVRVMGVNLADRTQYLNDLARVSGGVLTFAFVAKGDVNPATWNFPGLGTGWAQADVSGTIDRIVCPLRLPDGCTITSIVASVTGGGVHSATPQHQPILDVRRYSSAGVNSVGQVTDGVAFPAYDAPHSFTLSGLSEVVSNATSAYVATLQGEWGTNALPGMEAFCVTVHFTPHA